MFTNRKTHSSMSYTRTVKMNRTAFSNKINLQSILSSKRIQDIYMIKFLKVSTNTVDGPT